MPPGGDSEPNVQEIFDERQRGETPMEVSPEGISCSGGEVKTLKAQGLIKSEKQGRTKYIMLTPAGASVAHHIEGLEMALKAIQEGGKPEILKEEPEKDPHNEPQKKLNSSFRMKCGQHLNLLLHER